MVEAHLSSHWNRPHYSSWMPWAYGTYLPSSLTILMSPKLNSPSLHRPLSTLTLRYRYNIKKFPFLEDFSNPNFLSKLLLYVVKFLFNARSTNCVFHYFRLLL
ncbi:102aa long hypothetical protein [Pyrococcus horikoshii OT3]|uniref:Uncharacterized protein n=1 Tax=Pyrococcus horikoshii (strain ATCC 700860 / DSM 12428 / JCM 9974 / NBRC 100139 / OT-3) TaxID=70601 RepID=O59419_PYRHO|nr:102aa long hypothetical protein [Pyrococcus horikoshii OT3]